MASDGISLRRLIASDCMQVRLPGGLLVQAAFHPQEPVENVLTLALSCLEERVSDVSLRPYLFTTPPRNVLNMQASLAEAGLVPAATAILAWHAPLPAPLASLTGEALLRPFALALLSVAAGTGTDAPVPVAAFPTAKEDAAAAKDESSAARASAIGKRLLGGGASGTAGGSGSAVSSATGTAGAEGASSSSAGDAKSGKPKWLKM
jgi:hypothetical protein